MQHLHKPLTSFTLLFYVGLFTESGWLHFIFVAGEGGETQK